ncbi:AAA family ATPase [Parasulfitobacter algicola]|uniref:AAA family ATPase n=1 Tax=Parasulfitobacter algicola TaxID=2614809 RepID=A0ABX2IZ74_9RHOB|nr:AAA family ATPase [Sulfitobacter algicola]NSX56004.1 AAA family ATPase [Sulfitobacter algicola]
MSSAMVQSDEAQITACTICRDIQNFDLLIDDMEGALGESWGDLGFNDAMSFFKQPDASQLEFVAIAVDAEDEEDLTLIEEIVKGAKDSNIKVILIADEVSPAALHRLLQTGADSFVPYPLPDGELHAAIERIRIPEPEITGGGEGQVAQKFLGSKNGVVLPVHGLAGGSGATTFAVNLAWELANVYKKDNPTVCVLDFELQFGNTATYLDLARREAVYELLVDTENMDRESFLQALQPFKDKVHVLTAPTDILPLDLIGPEDVLRILAMAKANFDYVIVDMPSTLVAWTETVLNEAQVYFTLFEMDMRSAQNAIRMIKALKAEELPYDRLRFVVNRAPKFTDMQGKARVKRMGETLDIKIEVQLPDGGKQVMESGDHGEPLAETAGKNPLRKEIQKLAASLHELNVEAAAQESL